MMMMLGTVTSWARPGYTKPVDVIQPDGTTLTLLMRGDEYLSFMTTTDGYTVIKGEDGFYRYAEKENEGLKATAFIAKNPDERQADEQAFLAETLKLQYAGVQWNALKQQSLINGLGMNFNLYNLLNDKHYAATASDILQPRQPAICAMQYADGTSAAVAYDGSDCKTFAIGFPFECIREQSTRESVMRGIMNFLLK